MKLNRYEKIMARPDRKRPHFLNELKLFFNLESEAMVLDIKVLTPLGDMVRLYWTEKDADKARLEKK